MDPRALGFDEVLRLLTRDVELTLGPGHLAIVANLAANARQLEIEDHATKVVEDVQQYFQDTFVDTTWPACPRHPNHPLDYMAGAWHCPRDGAEIVPLGQLQARSNSSK